MDSFSFPLKQNKSPLSSIHRYQRAAQSLKENSNANTNTTQEDEGVAQSVTTLLQSDGVEYAQNDFATNSNSDSNSNKDEDEKPPELKTPQCFEHVRPWHRRFVPPESSGRKGRRRSMSEPPTSNRTFSLGAIQECDEEEQEDVDISTAMASIQVLSKEEPIKATPKLDIETRARSYSDGAKRLARPCKSSLSKSTGVPSSRTANPATSPQRQQRTRPVRSSPLSISTSPRTHAVSPLGKLLKLESEKSPTTGPVNFIQQQLFQQQESAEDSDYESTPSSARSKKASYTFNDEKESHF